MAEIVYLNGAYRPSSEATVHYEDRGYQFSDGVYEVILVRRGRTVDAAPHLARLDRSLAALDIDAPLGAGPLNVIVAETIRRNRVVEGLVYIQVTRGVASRDHVFPGRARPSIVCVAKKRDWPAAGSKPKAISAISVLDERWARCDIKSVGLLANVLAKEKAKQGGGGEAILVSADGTVREGGSSNLWIVTADGRLRTHPLDQHILGGVTRQAIVALAEGAQIHVDETAFKMADLLGAREVFVTSATSFVKPVTKVDGKVIGDGAVGPVTLRLFDLYNAHTLA